MSAFGDRKNNAILQKIGVVGGATAAVLGLLALKYPDRAIFDEHREGIVRQPGWPLVGGLPSIVGNKEQMHELFMAGFENTGALTTTTSALGIPRTIITINPKNVEHILKDNFENYVKGPQFHGATTDLFGHGIFNANGEQWKYQRKTASLVFNVKNFRDEFTKVFVEEIDYMNEHIFNKACESGQPVDFHDIMFKFTLDSFILLGFGAQLNALDSEDKVPFAASFDVCQANSFQRFVNPVWRITETVQSILQPWKMSISDHLKVVDSFADDVIDRRRAQIANGETHRDLLSRFMSASNQFGEPLSNRELRDIILNFVIAGRDTTAQALSWTFYNLCNHPRIENKLLDEINEYITPEMERDPVALYEAIKNMKYAHAVFYEVLRLHPSVPSNQKYALKDDIWPDGTQIKKGDYVMWSPWAQGRNEQIWKDAKQFNPERWISPQGELRRESQGQWPAFHAGPRICLGQNLATLEAIVAIVFLVKRYEFTIVPGQNITYQVSLTLPMKYGMKVYVNKRQ
ncbi:cytochrome P450 [Zychaea mexicana]|uniref:cytochrome P450 n=1 Tax=Zychaea mexicana TaxID=64656 RepID=UPI0022FE8F9C|nr:cytochrome P450 [Zychaea mexicana]KAI9490825.1 cytochrome P450 [Zychaea mexicana]